MAIAGFVIHTTQANLQDLLKILQNSAEIPDCQVIPPNLIAATLETPSLNILRAFKMIDKLPGVLNLEIVYINYEDDLERDGGISCPPISELAEK